MSNLPSPRTPAPLRASESPAAALPPITRSHALAGLPIPVLLVVIVGLWIADLRTVYESRMLMVVLNLFFTFLASLCIGFLTARGFLGNG
ncbi:MAG: hypothetical protein ACOYEV_18670, partial [Candidatus Nanopelagicales bacterium]